jgi:hypothetical protein
MSIKHLSKFVNYSIIKMYLKEFIGPWYSYVSLALANFLVVKMLIFFLNLIN